MAKKRKAKSASKRRPKIGGKGTAMLMIPVKATIRKPSKKGGRKR